MQPPRASLFLATLTTLALWAPAAEAGVSVVGSEAASAVQVRLVEGPVNLLMVSGSDDADRVKVVEDGSKLKVIDRKARVKWVVDADEVDLIYAQMGNGDDVYDGSAVTSKSQDVSGENGEDTLTGGDMADTMSGGGDADVVKGGKGDDTVKGDDGDDWLKGGDQTVDDIDGEGGADTIEPNKGSQVNADAIAVDHQDNYDGAYNGDKILCVQTADESSAGTSGDLMLAYAAQDTAAMYSCLITAEPGRDETECCLANVGDLGYFAEDDLMQAWNNSQDSVKIAQLTAQGQAFGGSFSSDGDVDCEHDYCSVESDASTCFSVQFTNDNGNTVVQCVDDGDDAMTAWAAVGVSTANWLDDAADDILDYMGELVDVLLGTTQLVSGDVLDEVLSWF